MPYLQIQTNHSIEAEHRAVVLHGASGLVAEQLGKAERYVMVALRDAAPMLFAGSDAPAAYLELKSIGLPAEATARLSDALCEFMERELEIPRDRVYVEFADAPRHMWGWNGGTF
ncbi:MAG: hypothetical protein GWO16_02425 [Gammaproteobacteria bacterium]|nr:hypothetical protein [Gammaproteobacteria bacterium]NIR97004.1 hypothetical protein [Gammaproteobacteria bacterium]NIT62706.1 hypothetical protein [Gammaproteobacteria bacterium]NIV19662.1 hypothetical protein [Gammaproteobacteria bacterium]NIY31286.1 hypothetical protein [Gammaproteobacteria bacterium]